MVSQRIFQATQGLALASALLLVSSAQASPPAEAEPDNFTIAAIALDLRPGDEEVRRPSQEAFIEALGMYGEFELPGELELQGLLLRQPYSASLEQGRATLSAAILSFGSLDCVQTRERSQRAALDFAAAMAAGDNAASDLRQAYLYLLLCADRSANIDDAMAVVQVLETLTGGERPTEISENTWQKYPVPDAQSNQQRWPVQIESDPSGADIWIDYNYVGATPSTQLLSPGAHVLAIGLKGRSLSQQIEVRGAGKASLKLPPKTSHWAGLAKSLKQALEAKGETRPKAIRAVMAAAEADVAFVLREPGRIAVWIAPSNRGASELLGHAPNAEIAGRLALEGLRDAERAPGLDSDFPLLREGDQSVTTASSTRRWWIYGAVLGAAAIAAGVIVAQDLGEDRQSIELSLP